MMYAYLAKTKPSVVVGVVALAMVMTGQPAQAQPGTVLSHQKISHTQGGGPPLDDEDRFGMSATSLGDLDGDGVGDLAVGAMWDDDGGFNRGAVWILFLNIDGTVKSYHKISDTSGDLPIGALTDVDWFGNTVSSLGDLDGDGVGDLAVGAQADDDGGTNRGAVWILFLNTDGTVKSHQKISNTQGNFTGILNNSDLFGKSVTSLGDLDGDRVGDLAVGAMWDDDGGPCCNTDRGAVWILFLNDNGTVKAHQKISDTQGNFTGKLDDADQFGVSVGSLDDLDGDGVGDLAVGANFDDDGGPCCNTDRGAVWILFLNDNGTVKSHHKISDTSGDLPPGALDDDDRFGRSVTSLDDHDGDGVSELAVGAFLDDDGGNARGAVWVFLSGGTVQKISDTEGNFTGGLHDADLFGTAVVSLGDLDGDGIGDMAVSAMRDDDGEGLDRGAVWILFLDGVATTPPNDFNAFRGFHASGTLDDVLASDDMDLCHDLGITIFPSEAPITLDFDGTLPNDSPASLDVTFESSANTPGLELTISFWNYNTNSWDVIGTAAQGFNVDEVRTFAGDPVDHIESGTGSVRTRYEVRQAGIIFQFPWTDCIDHVFWTVSN